MSVEVAGKDDMDLLEGLRILLRDNRFNLSFFLSLVAAGIISFWVVVIGTVNPPDITNPVQGLGISIVVSFQYFMILLVILSRVDSDRFFGTRQGLINQFLLCIGLVLVFAILGPISALAGPVVGAALTFCDAVITAFFAVLLGWNIGQSVHNRVLNRKAVNWVLFLMFYVIDLAVFGYAYFVMGLSQLPLENQMVLLIFPLGIVILPVLTIVLRDRQAGPHQTSLVVSVLLVLGIYHTFRLVNISDPQLVLTDIVLQMALMIYGLATTVAKIEKRLTMSPSQGLTIVLFVILSRVGSYVNRLLAAATAWGNIVQVGITSFTIVNMAVLGLLIPVIWMRRRRTTDTVGNI